MSEIIYGIHALEGIIERSPERILTVYLLKNRDNDKRLNQLIGSLEALGISVKLVDKNWLDERTQQGTHQGIMAEIKEGRSYQENDLAKLLTKENPLVLILDGVTDPHNLGACIRSADAAGVDVIIVPKDKSAPLNAIAKKVACGAAESVPLIRVTNLARTMRMLKEEFNIWIVGMAGEATHTLYQSKLEGSLAIVMGAEGSGMRRLTKEHCDELLNIPMAGLVSSLNVSVATGICLFEAVRNKCK